MEKLETTIGYRVSTLKTAEVTLSSERLDQTIAGARSEQVHIFQLMTKCQIGQTRVADSLRPTGLEASELAQLLQNIEPVIGDRTAGASQLQIL
jgi:hypothetical protein